MKPGRTWMFLVPLSAVGVGLALAGGSPTLRGGEAASNASDSDAESHPLRASGERSNLKLQGAPRQAAPGRLPFSGKPRLAPRYPRRIVPATFQLGKADKANDESKSKKGDIAASGPDAGKTVNPHQPIPPYRKSVGAQDASLTVDWVTPESIVLMKQGKFDLVLRNRGRIPVEQITITNVLPKGFRFVKAEPKPTTTLPKKVWIVKKLDPQEEARISLYLIPTTVGNMTSHARVDFHAVAKSTLKVVEPKIAVVAEGPDKVLVGNQAVFNVTIKNPGTGKATNVRMKAFLPKALQAIAAGTEYDLSTLNPGESRTIRVLARMKSLGKHNVKFVAIADDNLRAEANKQVLGLQAKLEIAITGPKFRYLARPAKYKVTVKNTGNAVAQNVNLSVRVPRAFAYLSGGDKGRFDASTKTVNQYVGTLGIGKTATAEFQLKAVNRGNFPLLAEATADRSLTAKDKHITRVEGIAAILLEVVDVDDPVEVGAVTYYEILVTNQGTEFAKNIRINATMPEGITLLGSKGPSEGKINGRTITFEPLPKLAPRADAIYRIKVRTTKPGDLRIEATATADTLKSPVKELESTKVYSDRAN